MWGSRGAWVVSLFCALLVGGCGKGEAPPPSTPTASSPTSATASPSADQNGSMVPPLPDLTNFPTGKTSPLPPVGEDTPVYGADMSWPQCPKGMGIPQKRSEGAPLPTAAAKFVVLGLTNGPSFVANPCLAQQLAWVRQRHLRLSAYSIVSFPDARTEKALRTKGPFKAASRSGGLSNVGYQAALFNIATMKRVGLDTPMVWIDVEPVVGFDWSADVPANAAVVKGVARAYREGGYRIGFYSTPVLWKRVVGGLRFGADEWRAAGMTSQAEALHRCGNDWSFQGGRAVMGQWVEDGRDRDVTCPGASLSLDTWFGAAD